MGWESVEELPGLSTGDAYRGAAEVVVARRSGLSLFERIRLWWFSTPEIPFADVAREVVVTPNYVYVKKDDGVIERARRELLSQGRVEAGRRRYALPGATDLVVADRKGDDVEVALKGPTEPLSWVSPRHWGRTLFLLVGLVLFAIGVCDSWLREGADAVAAGRYNSESAYGFYLCVASWSVVVFVFFFFPRRVIVDAVGIRSIRGLLAGMRLTVPVERIQSVEVKHLRVRVDKRETRHYFFVYANTAQRFRTRIKLRRFERFDRYQAHDFAELCAKVWNAPLKGEKRPERKPWI